MKKMQEAIEKAIQISGLQLLLNKTKLIFMLEDLVPYLQEDIAFIEKMYSLEVGRILFEKWNVSRSKCSFNDVELFLSENEGFNAKWIKKFVSFFEGLNIEPCVCNRGGYEEIISQVVDELAGENFKSYNQIKEKWMGVLQKAIVNKKNQLFFYPEIPEKKLIKFLKSQKNTNITKEQVMAALFYDNGIMESDGILLSERYMLWVCRKEAISIPIAEIKSVKTYFIDADVAIKVLLRDGTIIPTGIMSRKYNISAITEYLQGVTENVNG